MQKSCDRTQYIVRYLERMCEIMGFVSPQAKDFALRCKDHHVAWTLLLVFHLAVLRELVLPFVRHCMREGVEDPKPEDYMAFFKAQSHVPNVTFMHEQVCRYSQAIINLRAGIRRNNSGLGAANSLLDYSAHLTYAL